MTGVIRDGEGKEKKQRIKGGPFFLTAPLPDYACYTGYMGLNRLGASGEKCENLWIRMMNYIQ